MSLCIGAYTIGGAIVTIAGGVATPDEVRTYISIYGTPVNSGDIELSSPAGTYGIDYALTNNILLFAEHHSSPVDCDDHPGVNMAGVKVITPLFEGVNVYGGVAVHNEGFDSNNDLRNPIYIGGAELEIGGEDVVLFTEYITDDFDEGQVSAGVKFYFN